MERSRSHQSDPSSNRIRLPLSTTSSKLVLSFDSITFNPTSSRPTESHVNGSSIWEPTSQSTLSEETKSRLLLLVAPSCRPSSSSGSSVGRHSAVAPGLPSSSSSSYPPNGSRKSSYLPETEPSHRGTSKRGRSGRRGSGRVVIVRQQTPSSNRVDGPRSDLETSSYPRQPRLRRKTERDGQEDVGRGLQDPEDLRRRRREERWSSEPPSLRHQGSGILQLHRPQRRQRIRPTDQHAAQDSITIGSGGSLFKPTKSRSQSRSPFKPPGRSSSSSRMLGLPKLHRGSLPQGAGVRSSRLRRRLQVRDGEGLEAHAL